MVRVLIGSLLGGMLMFVIGFIFWASPLNHLAFSSASEQQSANVQLAAANNLPHVGRYIIPNPETAGGTVLYGKGPVAVVDYNPQGFSTQGGPWMLGGFIHEVVVAGLIGFSLLAVAGRVTDFESRARLVIGFSAAGAVLLTLSDPIWMHADWHFAIYNLVASLAMLVGPGLLIARWFLPKGPAVTLH
ncbi:hypothetical protein FHS31_001929 [Sphingomonas vulcanisoli]|uniref:Uncharacterized protein n=1 Tax=Sphingomonas vulcanisoli TaxID=1658060 RepID=A0ABX0TS31_9SPHN|nr:hypothetical protein [Sphingomonas vulcanisoli]NIJ08312.1 hypothetical protein [Sphingomonas vulcanisoli]